MSKEPQIYIAAAGGCTDIKCREEVVASNGIETFGWPERAIRRVCRHDVLMCVEDGAMDLPDVFEQMLSLKYLPNPRFGRRSRAHIPINPHSTVAFLGMNCRVRV